MARRPHTPDTVWITTTEAAKYARCSPGSIWTAVKRGRLRAAKIGRNLRFREEWINQWLEASTTPIECTAQGGR